MRIFYFFAVTLFSASLMAADFQVAEFALGTTKTDLPADVLAKTSVTVLGAQAQLETQWTENKLSALVLTFYQGADYAQLRQKFSDLHQQFTSELSPLRWISPDATADTTDTVQTSEPQLALLDQVMKAAPETAAGYKQSHLANSNLILDFQPNPQADNSRLHLKLSFSSLNEQYTMVLFVDEKASAERTAAAVVNLEAF